MPASIVPHEEIVTPAVVVRTRAFGESDKIVTFLTRDRGKVAGIAKGAQRSKRRFVNVLEPFTHVEVTLRTRTNRDLAFVDACVLRDAPIAIARDLVKFAYGSYVLELTDRMVREHEAGPETYELVRDAIALLEHGDAEPGILRGFELHLLRLTGYEPELDRCRKCGASAGPDATMYVYPARGGVLCVRCRGEGRAYQASPPVLERLIALQRTEFSDCAGEHLRLAPAMAAEARALVRCFFAADLTAPLASEKLLESL
ncbi:MAG: DNA repair protein RecO [Deltaproteobacteria bacterium]|nr:DNA repair protein RecO [Deltaproteobacteria bacterium]